MDYHDQTNPAEQVERIRDILIGPELQLTNERIQQLESSLRQSSEELSSSVNQQLERAEQQQKALQEDLQVVTEHIRHQLQQESVTRGLQINDLVSKLDETANQMSQISQRLSKDESGQNQAISRQIENLSAEMTSRIDAHSRQIMEHMHREIQQWKHRMDEQISALSEQKVNREELGNRLARIASAAMGDSTVTAPKISSSGYKGPSIPRPNLGSLTGISPSPEAPPGPHASGLDPASQDPHGLPSLNNPDIFPGTEDKSNI